MHSLANIILPVKYQKITDEEGPTLPIISTVLVPTTVDEVMPLYHISYLAKQCAAQP